MFDPMTTTDDYVFMVVTHKCNMSCKFCVDKMRGVVGDIDSDAVMAGVKYAKTNGIKTITLLGGEPTLHPDIISITKLIKQHDFEVVMTTNYTKPEIVKKLDEYVDSFNISHYGQNKLPNQKDFSADLTLSKLIFKGQNDNRKDLDAFIDKYESQFSDIKFSTLPNVNKFTNSVANVGSFLDSLPIQKKITLMGEIEGHYYRGYLIKRFDIPATKKTYHKRSMKIHPNGEIKREW